MNDLPHWYEGLAPVRVELPVGPASSHRITWDAGALTLDAHPDAEAEDVLAALGGERCPCLDVLDAWQAQLRQPDVLVIGRRHPGEHVRADRTVLSRLEREAARWQAQWQAAGDDLRTAGDAAAAVRLRRIAEPAERRARIRLGFVRILALDAELQDRLVATVVAGAEARWHDDEFRAANCDRLHAALAGRALPPLLETGILPAGATDADGLAAIELLDPGEPATVEAVPAGRRRNATDIGISVRLPLSWLTNVWARGVSVVDGQFVVAVTGVQDGGKVLTVLGVDGIERRWIASTR